MIIFRNVGGIYVVRYHGQVMWTGKKRIKSAIKFAVDKDLAMEANRLCL